MVPRELRTNPEVRDDGCLDLLSNNDMRNETTDTEGCRFGIAFDDGYECIVNSGHWEDVGLNEGLNGHPSNEIQLKSI